MYLCIFIVCINIHFDKKKKKMSRCIHAIVKKKRKKESTYTLFYIYLYLFFLVFLLGIYLQEWRCIHAIVKNRDVYMLCMSHSSICYVCSFSDSTVTCYRLMSMNFVLFVLWFLSLSRTKMVASAAFFCVSVFFSLFYALHFIFYSLRPCQSATSQ